MEVRTAVGRGRPRHGGASGRVVVSFGLTPDGVLRFAEIAGSSGNAKLDQAALAAIRHVAFPRPPEGMMDSERIYSVPFEFK